ncbi:MAG: hypothetical protein NVS9B3_04100 [Gemmatimonadaceae bacterium]
MTLRARLALGLSATAALMIIPLAVALHGLEQLHRSASDLRDRDFAASLLVSRLRAATQDLRDAETALLFLHDDASRARMSGALGTLTAMADTLDHYALGSAAGDVRRRVSAVADAAPREFVLALAGHVATAESLSTTTIRPTMGGLDRSLSQAETDLRERTRARVKEAAQVAADARFTSALVLILVLSVALVAGVWLTRSISRPVADLDRGLSAVAGGDFLYVLPARSGDREDEFGRLAQSFSSMSRQLAELDRLKSEFVSIASHELKTPINVILGYLQLIAEGAYGDTTPRQREILATLQAQAQTLGRLVKQLLDLSRLEAGSVRLNPRRIPPGPFLSELERTFQVLADQRQINFRIVAHPTLPREVTWDGDRMNEVLGNLLTNAFKFTPPGGEVEIVADGLSGEIVEIAIRDTGAGIPSDQLPRVFEKFYQADNQDRASHEGSGLGLAITKEIVEAHSGRIAVVSTPGAGTTFTITLPCRAGADPAGSTNAGPTPS